MALPRSNSEIVADLAEDFVRLHRQGKRPNIREYVRQFPHLEQEISELFPTLLVVENLAPGHDASVVGAEQEALRPAAVPEILGDFRILREVGRGGMGVVYEAEQVSLSRRVALKVLANQQWADAKHRIRFQREARSAARLHHTNIVPVFGVGEEQGMSYYVMQLIQGLGLDELLDELRRMKSSNHDGGGHRLADFADQRGNQYIPETVEMARTLLHGEFGQSSFAQGVEPTQVAASARENPRDQERNSAIADVIKDSSGKLSGSFSTSDSPLAIAGQSSSSVHTQKSTYWDSVARIGFQVANALQYAHEHSILHRDIKPSNLLLDHSGTVWVTDFGLAKVMDQQDLTHTGDILGTLRYMPPEAFTSNTDHRGDIYSLGISIYEMLALRPAFDESDRHRLIARVSESSPNRLERVDAEIPRDLVTIVHKAIDRDPAHRYQSAQDMAEDFRRFIADEPIQARRVSAFERLARWSRRNKGMTVALTSIAALLVIGSVASMVAAIYFRKQESLAEYSQYVSNIQAANSRTGMGFKSSTILVRRALRATPSKHRNWEWAFLANIAWRPDSTNDGSAKSLNEPDDSAQFWQAGESKIEVELVSADETGAISEGQFSSDGKHAILVQKNGSLAMFDLADGKEVKSYREPDTHLNTVGLSPDGRMVVSSAIAGGALIFDLATDTRVMQPIGSIKGTVWDWEWSPDQKYVLSTHFGGSVQVLNAATLDQVAEFVGHDSEARDFHFPQSNDFVWTASFDGTIRTWSFPKGKELTRTEAPLSEGEDMVYHAIAPDGRCAVASCKDGASFLWDIETKERVELGKPLGDVNAEMRRKAATFSPDGSCVAVMSGLFAVTIYDTQSGLGINSIKGHESPLRSIAFNPDGTRLMTIANDGVALIWTARQDQSDNKPTLLNAHDDVIYQIDLSENRLLTGAFDSRVSVWDMQTRTWMGSYNDHVTEAKGDEPEDMRVVAVDLNNTDPNRAASLDSHGVLHVWDVESQKQIFHIDPESELFASHMGRSGGGRRGMLLSYPAVLSTGLFSPDGRYVVAFKKDSMKVFSAKDGSVKVSLRDASDHGWPVYSRDSKLVAILEMGRERASVWNVETGEINYELGNHKYALGMIAFSPATDRLVTGGMDGIATIWNSQNGKRLHDLKGEFGHVVSCRFSPDGRFVFTGHFDNLARIWNADNGELVTTLFGHTGAVCDVRMNPDGTRFLTWSLDRQAIVWDAVGPFANQLVALTGESRLLQAHWSPDGRDIVTAWSDGSIRVLFGATKGDLSSFLGRSRHSVEEFEEMFDLWRRNDTNSPNR